MMNMNNKFFWIQREWRFETETADAASVDWFYVWQTNKHFNRSSSTKTALTEIWKFFKI